MSGERLGFEKTKKTIKTKLQSLCLGSSQAQGCLEMGSAVLFCFFVFFEVFCASLIRLFLVSVLASPFLWLSQRNAQNHGNCHMKYLQVDPFWGETIYKQIAMTIYLYLELLIWICLKLIKYMAPSNVPLLTDLSTTQNKRRQKVDLRILCVSCTHRLYVYCMYAHNERIFYICCEYIVSMYVCVHVLIYVSICVSMYI